MFVPNVKTIPQGVREILHSQGKKTPKSNQLIFGSKCIFVPKCERIPSLCLRGITFTRPKIGQLLVSDLDLWPPKSNQLFLESKGIFVPKLKKFPQGILETLRSQEWEWLRSYNYFLFSKLCLPQDGSCWFAPSPVDCLMGSFQKKPHTGDGLVLSEHPGALGRPGSSWQYPPVCRNKTNHPNSKQDSVAIHKNRIWSVCLALMCSQTQNSDQKGQGSADVDHADSLDPQLHPEETVFL